MELFPLDGPKDYTFAELRIEVSKGLDIYENTIQRIDDHENMVNSLRQCVDTENKDSLFLEDKVGIVLYNLSKLESALSYKLPQINIKTRLRYGVDYFYSDWLDGYVWYERSSRLDPLFPGEDQMRAAIYEIDLQLWLIALHEIHSILSILKKRKKVNINKDALKWSLISFLQCEVWFVNLMQRHTRPSSKTRFAQREHNDFMVFTSIIAVEFSEMCKVFALDGTEFEYNAYVRPWVRPTFNRSWFDMDTLHLFGRKLPWDSLVQDRNKNIYSEYDTYCDYDNANYDNYDDYDDSLPDLDYDGEDAHIAAMWNHEDYE